ncbi:M48 family metallopeptidase [Priestia koreensis]|uniref:Peptidase M48 n=1 Tax=Priestia koreensis TaxID=284581 RepID=A0A0M0LIH2_9BACI|nr:M48 family metallopeptidase [Priestia koreensis]KOO50781.1 peptidase M48 [Priestia koreensis]
MHRQLVHDKEKIYFILCLIVSIIIYFLLIFSIVGIIVLILGLFISWWTHGLIMGSIRRNGVRLTEKQYPDIHKKAAKMIEEMDLIRLPHIFIVQSEGALNAFATRFFGRNFVVLYSNIVEIAAEGHDEELQFVIAHELAHIKQNHIVKNILILPAMWVPYLGSAYSRACEYTCDRMASAYIKNEQAAVHALGVLAVGTPLSINLNVKEYIATSMRETGLFVWMSEKLSTHPPLPKRIKAVQNFYTYPESYGVPASFLHSTQQTISFDK